MFASSCPPPIAAANDSKGEHKPAMASRCGKTSDKVYHILSQKSQFAPKKRKRRRIPRRLFDFARRRAKGYNALRSCRRAVISRF
jgi:hypothetical protein